MGIELFAALAAGGALALLAVGVVRSMAVRPEDARIRALGRGPVAQAEHVSSGVIRRGPSSLPLLRRTLENSTRASRWEREINQAGLRLRVGEYFMIRAGLALVVFVVVAIAGGNAVAFFAGLLCAAMAFMLPAYWLAFLGKRRIDRLGKQLPEAVTMIANALKSGFAFQHGVAMVAEQLEPPISTEFARMIVDLNVGASVEEALHSMLERANSEDMNLIVTAILIQRQSGGNLSEILETVGETMRERERLSGEIKTLTSQQRFSGMVLSFWPVIILGIFALFNWQQTKLLFTTNVGLVLVSLAAVGQVLGYYTIRRILDIDI